MGEISFLHLLKRETSERNGRVSLCIASDSVASVDSAQIGFPLCLPGVLHHLTHSSRLSHDVGVSATNLTDETDWAAALRQSSWLARTRHRVQSPEQWASRQKHPSSLSPCLSSWWHWGLLCVLQSTLLSTQTCKYSLFNVLLVKLKTSG